VHFFQLRERNMDDKNKDTDVADTAKGTARSTLGGAVAGAVAGTALGVPVAGAVIGALSGAAIGAARKRTTGTKRKAKSASSPPKKKTSGTKNDPQKQNGRPRAPPAKSSPSGRSRECWRTAEAEERAACDAMLDESSDEAIAGRWMSRTRGGAAITT